MNKSTGNLWDSAGEGAYARMNQAWQWLCEQRENAPEGADTWDIRWQVLSVGPEWLTELTHQVLRREYRLAPLQLQGKNESRKAVWGACDALVLKWTALSLQHLLPLHPACEHVKGHGGGKQSIMKLHGLLTQDACAHGDEKKTAATSATDDAVQAAVNSRQYKWVCRTDIRGYYRHIDKQTLLSQVRQHVTSPVLRDLVDQYIHYTVEDGGTFHTPEKGISRGCPLSPLMGALHLYDMDEHFAKQQSIHYARYMDDIIILAKSRWALRRHTKRLMQWFSEYGFEAHPDKTFIGRTEKGFDWMGAWLTHEGVTDIAPRAKANHREKVRRLYERLARVPLWRRKRARQVVHAKVSTYRKRWNIWAGGITALTVLALAAGPSYAGVGQQVAPLAITTPPTGVRNTQVAIATPDTFDGGRGADPWGACTDPDTIAWVSGVTNSTVTGTPNYVGCLRGIAPLIIANYKGSLNQQVTCPSTSTLTGMPKVYTIWSRAGGQIPPGCTTQKLSSTDPLYIELYRRGTTGGGGSSTASQGLLMIFRSNNPDMELLSFNSLRASINQAVPDGQLGQTPEPSHDWFCVSLFGSGGIVLVPCLASGGSGPVIAPPKPPMTCALNTPISAAATTFHPNLGALNTGSANTTPVAAELHVPITVQCNTVASAAGSIDLGFTLGTGGDVAATSPYKGYKADTAALDTYMVGSTAAGTGCVHNTPTASTIYLDGMPSHYVTVAANPVGGVPQASYTKDTYWTLCKGGKPPKLGSTTLPVTAEVHVR